jgi:acyl carrier protein
VQDELGVKVTDLDALGRTKTVGDVVAFMQKQVGSSAPARAPAMSAPAPVGAAAPAAAGKDAMKVVYEVMAEKTGYDTDMISEEMDLETDLGIDSIKRVEILGAVQDELNVKVTDLDALGRTKTVGDVVAFMQKQVGSMAPAPAPTMSAPAPVAAAAPAAAGGLDAMKVVYGVMADKTGYDTDMISEEMDLETDLGIDSIKRVEILGAVQDELNVKVTDLDALGRTKTVGDVVAFMQKQVGAVAPAPVAALPVATRAPAPAAPAPVASGKNAMKVVYEIMADKTGYDTDMISEEMDLETDLGIDSIKRVEILGAVQDELNVKVTDLDALGRTKTVGDVVAFMQKQVGSAAPAAPPAAVSAPAMSAPAPAASGKNAMKVVYEIMADKTGYDTDMISEEMDLETDLGIDSIKRVEILGAVQDELNVKVTDLDALGRTKTVGDVVAFMQKQVGSAAPAPVSAPASAAPVMSAPAPAASSLNAMNVVYEIMADKTGYDTDMISEEMDLETDLGIDSIKRVEILGAVQDELNVKVTDLDALGRTKTVGDVVRFMQTQVSSSAGGSTAAAPAAATAAAAASSVENPCVSVSTPKLTNIPFPDADAALTYAPTDVPLIVYGPGHAAKAEALANLLHGARGLGKPALLPSSGFAEKEPEPAAAFAGLGDSKFIGVIYLHDGADPVRTPFNLSRLVSEKMQTPLEGPSQRRPFFFCVTEVDGKFGFCTEGSEASSVPSGGVPSTGKLFTEAACVMGLTKTLDMEWQNVFVKGIDFAVLDPSQIVAEVLDASLIYREIAYSADGHRFTVAMSEILTSAQKSVITPVSSSDVFLVTGGARGITPHCLREIATRVGGGVTYILLGRSPLEQIPAWAKGAIGGTAKDLEKAAQAFLKQSGEKVTPMLVRDLAGRVQGAADVLESIGYLEKAGARVIYSSCDISNGTRTAQTLGSILSENNVAKITGLIHASGVIRDKKIENKTGADFTSVYGTKFDGLMNVLEALKRLTTVDLKHVLLFSSLAGFCGNVAQSDYAMANEALNKYAQALKAANGKNLHVCAMDFGPWDSGMVTPMLKKHFEDNNVEVIPLLGGAQLVADLFCDYQKLPQVLVGNWMQLPKKTFAAPDSESKIPRAVVKQVSLPANRFLLGHQIQKGRVTLPVSAVVSICKQVCSDVGAGGWQFLGCDSVKLYQGLHLDVEDPSKQHLTLNIQCQPSVPLAADGTVTFVVSIRDATNPDSKTANRICYQAMCRMSASATPGKAFLAPKVMVSGPQDKLVADSTAVYEKIFHTEGFRIIKGVSQCDDNGIVLSCSSADSTGFDFEPGSCVNLREAIDFDVVGQAMVLWVKMQLGKASLPTEYFNIEMFEEEICKVETSKFNAVMTVLKNAGNGLVTGRVEVFNPASQKCLFKMDATVALNEKNIY